MRHAQHRVILQQRGCPHWHLRSLEPSAKHSPAGQARGELVVPQAVTRAFTAFPGLAPRLPPRSGAASPGWRAEGTGFSPCSPGAAGRPASPAPHPQPAAWWGTRVQRGKQIRVKTLGVLGKGGEEKAFSSVLLLEGLGFAFQNALKLFMKTKTHPF